MKLIITKCPHWVPATGIFLQSWTSKSTGIKHKTFVVTSLYTQITRCTLLHSIKGCANSVRMRHHHLLKLYTTGQVVVALTPSTTSATDWSALFDRPWYHFLQTPLLCLLGQNIPFGFQLWRGFEEGIIAYVGKTFGEFPSDYRMKIPTFVWVHPIIHKTLSLPFLF